MSDTSHSSILTFLFTDLEDSTRLWEQNPTEMRAALARHDELLKQVVEKQRGMFVKTTGDGLHAVFENPADSVHAALQGQRAIAAEPWPKEIGPLKVRMGLHSGESQPRDGDYFGPEVNLAARVMGLGFGGQVLLSEATAALVQRHLPLDGSLADLGENRLKGIQKPENVFQLCHPDLQRDFPPLKSLASFKHNLHPQLSSFIGRRRELDQVKTHLQKHRLVTLLGPGGTGKTRLMLQAAEEMIEDYHEGVWLVELAPLSNPDRIPERVAAALNVQEQPGHRIIDSLTEYLRRKEILLLLDNVEHLVRTSAEFAEHLLIHCPHVRVLATGREALFISGEVTIQIPSLSLPTHELEEIAASESVQLFLERARSVRPDFELEEQNSSVIAEVVRRLDGIPLALELAAARLRMMTIEQIKDRLNDRFRLLTGGSRTALPRQQTLQALIDWSWNLLDEKERSLLQRLSVFSGGWSLEAAQSVAGFEPLDELDVFNFLEQLINKSMVTVEFPPGEDAHYGLLESIRQFARDRLIEAEEAQILRGRHADYFVQFSLTVETHMRLSTMVPWMKRTVREIDNLRSVMAWSLQARPDLALRVSAALLSNWSHWIHPSEALNWLESSTGANQKVFRSSKKSTLQNDYIKALVALGLVKALLGRVSEALQTLDESIRLAEARGEHRLYAAAFAQKTSSLVQHWHEIPDDRISSMEEILEMCLEKDFEWESTNIRLILFQFHIQKGDIKQALSYFERAEQVVQKNRNPRSLALLYFVKARIAVSQGNTEEARTMFQQARAAFTRINDLRLELICKSEEAHVLRQSGNMEEALPIYHETILRWHELGNPIAVAHQLECLAFIAIARRLDRHAAQLLGSAHQTRLKMEAVSTNPQEVAELEQAHDQLKGNFGDAGLKRLIATGAEMKLDDAVQLALEI